MASWKNTKTHHTYANFYALQLIWLATMSNKSHYS
jgi:hypothetical protein